MNRCYLYCQFIYESCCIYWQAFIDIGSMIGEPSADVDELVFAVLGYPPTLAVTLGGCAAA
jgi:hypothetical protein